MSKIILNLIKIAESLDNIGQIKASDIISDVIIRLSQANLPPSEILNNDLQQFNHPQSVQNTNYQPNPYNGNMKYYNKDKWGYTPGSEQLDTSKDYLYVQLENFSKNNIGNLIQQLSQRTEYKNLATILSSINQSIQYSIQSIVQYRTGLLPSLETSMPNMGGMPNAGILNMNMGMMPTSSIKFSKKEPPLLNPSQMNAYVVNDPSIQQLNNTYPTGILENIKLLFNQLYQGVQNANAQQNPYSLQASPSKLKLLPYIEQMIQVGLGYINYTEQSGGNKNQAVANYGGYLQQNNPQMHDFWTKEYNINNLIQIGINQNPEAMMQAAQKRAHTINDPNLITELTQRWDDVGGLMLYNSKTKNSFNYQENQQPVQLPIQQYQNNSYSLPCGHAFSTMRQLPDPDTKKLIQYAFCVKGDVFILENGSWNLVKPKR